MRKLITPALHAVAEGIRLLDKTDEKVSSYLEGRIDALRTELRNRNSEDVDEGRYSFAVGTVYFDLIRECEKCGDYVINVVESKRGKRENLQAEAAL